jgi:dimethylhistidine N-methyltransferase
MATSIVTTVPGFSGRTVSTLEDDVRSGLRSTPKVIAPRNFYDERGSQLFEAITQLPEYYLTETETGIIAEYIDDLTSLLATEAVEIIELGAGCNQKTWLILEAFTAIKKSVVYRPVDISVGAMNALEQNFLQRFKISDSIHMHGLIGPYSETIDVLRSEPKTERSRLILFLGSNIGNMSFDEAIEFLLEIHLLTSPNDRVVVGFDRKKDLRVLQAAYDDSQGVTREFNLNLLDRMNAELGADFNRAWFSHLAFYDPQLEGMVSWLVSTRDQTVAFAAFNGAYVHFRQGEGIRTELSRKYSEADIRKLAHRAKFSVEKVMSDTKDKFSLVVLKPI